MTKINIQGSASGGGGGGGGVTSVAVTSGTTGSDVNVTGSPITTSGTITVNIPTADGSTTGKLSSTDWATFNGKQDALSLTTTGSSGASTLVGDTLNIPQYQGTLSLTTTGSSGAATLVGDTLNIPQYATSPAGSDTNVQYNSGGAFAGSNQFNFDGTNVAIGAAIGGAGSKKLTVTSADQCVALFDNNVTGSGIAFTDATTTDADQVGVGAFGDILCLRGGGNASGTAQLGNDYLTLRGGELRNFIPAINTISANTTISSANEDSYNAQVVEVTGAVTITIDSSVRDGFNASFIQMDANQSTFAASGSTLQNRQAHTQTAGQWATTTIYKNGSNVILAGDTA